MDPRHLGVHDEEIELSAAAAQDADALESIAGLYDLASLVLQSLCDGCSAPRVVIDDQHGEAVGQAILSHGKETKTPARRTGAIAL
jgi:hypothetical protein